MDLLLWRHAHALDACAGQVDIDRPLSVKGEKQAQKMSDWLGERLPKDTFILCSPALRTRQTVSYLNLPYTICEDISPQSTASSLLNAAGWMHTTEATVLVVGHQPCLSDAVNTIFGMHSSASLSFRKGAVWWIRKRIRHISDEPFILTIQDPELL